MSGSWKPRPAAMYSGGSMEEALAGMANNGRQPVGTANANVRNASAEVTGGTLKPRAVGKTTGDPTAPGTRKARTNVGYDRNGAHFGIQAWVAPPISPEAAPTRGGGRLLPSTIHRSTPDFNAARKG